MVLIHSLKILSFLNGIFFSLFVLSFFGIRFQAFKSQRFETYKLVINIIFRLLIGIFLILSQLPLFFRNLFEYFNIEIPYIETTIDISPLITASGFIILLTITNEEFTFLYEFIRESINTNNLHTKNVYLSNGFTF